MAIRFSGFVGATLVTGVYHYDFKGVSVWLTKARTPRRAKGLSATIPVPDGSASPRRSTGAVLLGRDRR